MKLIPIFGAIMSILVLIGLLFVFSYLIPGAYSIQVGDPLMAFSVWALLGLILWGLNKKV